jgi:curved DNA-binding protein CbpA
MNPDPYTVLGVSPDTSPAQITAAYRRLLRTLHPDGHQPDPDRLAAIIAAYQHLRDTHRDATHDQQPRTQPHHTDGTEPPPDPGRFTIPVRVHHPPPPPDLRAGPVHRHD